MTQSHLPLVVVKIGGSLFDHRALGPGLRRWLAEQPPARYLFIPGGGALADVIRNYHRVHGVDEETCHWLAIETMAINARVIEALAPGAETVDALQFCREDESRPNALPHDWRVTSDSIAARVAEVGKASRLILLKSTDLPEKAGWNEAARCRLVDAMFPEIVQRSEIVVNWVNFRALLNAICQ
jgi:aspartokinase-like uncharacterized kinase